MKIRKTDIEKAYLYLKNYAYHENLNLFLKNRVADFECSRYKSAIGKIQTLLVSGELRKNVDLKKWINEISFNLLPKSVYVSEPTTSQNSDDGLFISNVRDSDKYCVQKLNYFIDAPVELHIIEVLWCQYVGPILDSELTNDCYGNRLNDSVKKQLNPDSESSGGSHELFKRYIDQYNRWRDQSIDIATEIAKTDEDVALLSLDLKSYFYHMDIDFCKLRKLIKKHHQPDSSELDFAFRLTKIIEVIFKSYNQKVMEDSALTHAGTEKTCSPPIGFASSSIIANWYLAEFDRDVADKVRPAYYGRYVDDIIMVFKKPKFDIEKPLDSFISHYLEFVIDKSDGGAEYYVRVDSNKLPFQKEKLILQYFDHGHSRAGLEVFKQELDERSSAFRFLPSDHIERELDKFAYDILFEGSANKLRSVVGLAENQTELSKYISSHITAHRLCKLEKQDVVLPELKLFFKGVNALEFSRLWEKVYQYALITNKDDFLIYFYTYLKREIEKLEVYAGGEKRHSLTLKMKQDLQLYNQASLCLTLGLSIKKISDMTENNHDRLAWLVISDDLSDMVCRFREANLIRHHLVAWPLANYTTFEGDLTDEQEFINCHDKVINNNKVSLSPRFIHYDEWQLFSLPKSLHCIEEFSEWHKASHESYPNSEDFNQEIPVTRSRDNEASSTMIIETLSVGENEEKTKLRVALANLCLRAKDIESAIRKDHSPNIGFERQEDLFNILNNAVKEDVEILVMPEVSIPVSWLPFIVSHARKHQLGIVFGLEHWVIDDVVYNLTVEALPFKTKDKYRSCVVTARLKNHYAPRELKLIQKLRMTPANELPNYEHRYHKVKWKGLSFATYNCYELSDITHRSLFKSQLDLMFACVWNRDTNYYEHILESAVRDLHCYLVQSNTSQYGGSCVLRPAKTEKTTMLYVKGGMNASILTVELDVEALRKFQYKSTPDDGDIFKHLPPGFDSEGVLNR